MASNLNKEWEGYPIYYRFRPDKDYVIDEIVESQLFFADRDSLNDPFDCYINLIKLPDSNDYYRNLAYRIIKTKDPSLSRQIIRKNARDADMEELRTLYYDNLKGAIESMGICCFGISISNLSMWSHYANFHKGLCIQYDCTKDDLLKHMRPVNYVDKIETKEFKVLSGRPEDSDAINHLFYTKSTMWESEKEFRIVHNKGLVSINPNAIKRIIYGIKCDDKFIKKAIRKSKGLSNIEHWIARPATSIFGITLHKISY